jgi:Fe-S-cluster containining protein
MPFQCQRCGACCQWPGQVKVTEAEITQIAAFLGLEENAFIQSHTRLRADRQGLALIDQENGACVFFQNGGCAIQAVKPRQCVDFPNGWSFPGVEKVCKARWINEP